MDQMQFWQVIEQAKRDSQGDDQRQVQLVEEALQQLSLEEIETFERIYEAFHGRSYSKRLWEAISTLSGFVSDDSFHYFRAWLIGQGEGLFREVMQFPGRVSEFIDAGGDWWLEELNYAAYEVYERLTGQHLWQVLKTAEPYPLTGYDWLQLDTIERGDI